MSTNRFQKTNRSIAEVELLDEAFSNYVEELPNLRVDWETDIISGTTDNLNKHFIAAGLATEIGNERIRLSNSGRTLILRTTLNFDTLFGPSHQFDKYEIEKLIGTGKESSVFLARHRLMGRRVAIKLFYEKNAILRYKGIFESIDQSTGRSNQVFIFPVDVLKVSMPVHGTHPVEVDGIVFPYLAGETLREFLLKRRPLTPFFVREFIAQVGGGLADLHRAKIAHGDLHQENILVENSDNSRLQFAVVDFTGCAGDSLDVCIERDWKGFCEILAFILARIPLTHMSLQRHLGAKTFCLIKAIFDGSITNSISLDSAFSDNRYYDQYALGRSKFLEAKFQASDALSLVRHEEITSPAAARDLFVPFQPFFQEFSEFGSAILHGHRGSGKSSYVAALAMLPTSKVEFVDPRDKFGILFACRQGEFKQLRAVKSIKSHLISSQLKHLLIVKIIRRSLEILHECMTYDALGLGENFQVDPLIDFLAEVFPVNAIATFQASASERLESIYEAAVRYELAFTDEVLEAGTSTLQSALLNERSLVAFLSGVRASSGVLARTRFFILFDDCGTPNMPECMQRVLNELVRAANEIFCVKVTAERFSYSEEDSDGKVLESPHDYTPFNLAETLILRGGQQVGRQELKDYFEELLRRRLYVYESSDITDYLGKSFRSMTDFVRLLHKDPWAKGAYAGWDIIWQVADRTPRHLLEMISSIFTKAGVGPDSKVEIVKQEVQDEAVRAYSASKLRHISYIPGKIHAGAITIPLGQHLYAITVAFGRISRQELSRGKMRGDRERYHEKIGIEIDKLKELGKNAEEILSQLIRYAIFDDSLLGSTRDGGLKQVIFMFNRIYVPAFGLSVRREANWTIRSDRFELFLLNPIAEARSREIRERNTPDLFDNE